LVLPGASRVPWGWPPAITDAWVLATPAALEHPPAGLARAPIVEDDWARLRVRLVELLERAPAQGRAAPGWQTTLAWLPERARAAVHCRRRFAAEPGTGHTE